MEELIGAAEIEQRHGLNRMQVSRLIAAGDFPEPTIRLQAGRFWLADTVESAVARLVAAGRLVDGRVIPKQYARAEA